MAHTAADGSKWTNARQATQRSMAVPGKAQGDGKQPVKSFSTPEAPRADTASDAGTAPQSAGDSTSAPDNAPHVEVQQDGDMFQVVARFPTAEEAHAAAQALSGSDSDDQQQTSPGAMANPSQAMM